METRAVTDIALYTFVAHEGGDVCMATGVMDRPGKEQSIMLLIYKININTMNILYHQV